jgi:hypothetical protein
LYVTLCLPVSITKSDVLSINPYGWPVVTGDW